MAVTCAGIIVALVAGCGSHDGAVTRAAPSGDRDAIGVSAPASAPVHVAGRVGATGEAGAVGATAAVGATGAAAVAGVTGGVGVTGAAGSAGRQVDVDSGETVWLCRPGRADDPCETSTAATVVPASGPRIIQPGRVHPDPQFDCFYVYPTVSPQPTDNATLQVQPSVTRVTVAQASRFSQVCRVWAPMYRQRTVASLRKGLGGDPQADAVAYQSLLAAWRDYLANDNDGRPIIFIGHSQGAAMLIRLLAGQIEPDPALRSRTVLAILAGGNVAVPVGRTVGGTFAHLPLCTAVAQTGCVIAYSTFSGEPPSYAAFGRPGQGVSLMSGQPATSGVQVACVNPAALGGGTGYLQPYFRMTTSTTSALRATTGWVTYPGLYSARCRSEGGASWLQVDTLAAAGRPVIAAVPASSGWGYHAEDISLALGNLVADVTAAEATYSSRHS